MSEHRRLDDWGGLLTLVSWIHVASWSVVCFLVTVVALLALTPLWDRDRDVFQRIARLWGEGLARQTPVFSLEMRHLERCAGGPYVVVLNHLSRIDPLFALSLPMRHRMVVKSALLSSPLGLNLRLAGYVGAARSGDAEDARSVVSGCLDWIGRGVSVVSFPEGHRTADGAVGRFKRGAFDVATRAGVPILPVVVAGSDDVHPGWTVRFRYHQHVIVEVLEPLAAAGRATGELRDDTRRAISGRLAELREELRETRGQGGHWETPVRTTSTR